MEARTKVIAAVAAGVIALAGAIMIVFEPLAKDSAEATPSASDFGSNLAATPTGNMGCPGASPSCTYWNGSLPPGSTAGSLSAPMTGVIVSFTLKKAESVGWSPVHLRLVRPTQSLWSGLAASAPDVTPSNPAGEETFPVRLPVTAGDYVGLESDVRAIWWATAGVVDAQLMSAGPKLPADGQGFNAGFSDGQELLLRARVESDEDADGYGDVTQDLCPTDASSQAACPSSGGDGGATAPAVGGVAAAKKCKKGQKLKKGKCVKKKKKKK